MSKAYLAWPVKIIDGPFSFEGHVTAKYLGELDPVLAQMKTVGLPSVGALIRERLAGLPKHLDLEAVSWEPTKFNLVTYVLELKDMTRGPRDVAAALRDMRKDDYPGWRPHISVPKALWQHIVASGLPMQSFQLVPGPLTLYVDKKPVVSF